MEFLTFSPQQRQHTQQKLQVYRHSSLYSCTIVYSTLNFTHRYFKNKTAVRFYVTLNLSVAGKNTTGNVFI